MRGQSIKVAITTPQGLEIKVRGGVKLNETTAPRSLDWVDLLGPDRQPFPQVAGIYKLEGGTFTVCNGGFLGARPSEFESGDGALADVVVFHRLEAGRPGEAASAGSSPRRDSPPASPNGGSPEVSRVDRPGDVRR
ncbi:MAG: hypothetical protein U0790_17960 [Isosphaeraceae bacterium]